MLASDRLACRQGVVVAQTRQQHRQAAVIGQGLVQQAVPATATGIAPPHGLRRTRQWLVEPRRVAGPLLAQLTLQLAGAHLRCRRQVACKRREELPVELPMPSHLLAAQTKCATAAASGKQHRHPTAAGLGGLNRYRPQVLTTGTEQYIGFDQSLGQPKARPGADIGHRHHQVGLAPRLLEGRQQ